MFHVSPDAILFYDISVMRTLQYDANIDIPTIALVKVQLFQVYLDQGMMPLHANGSTRQQMYVQQA